MTASYVTLVLDRYDGAGNPYVQGGGTLTPSLEFPDPADQMLVGQAPVPFTFRSGSFPQVRIIANDTAGPQGVSLPGWTWNIAYNTGTPGSPQPASYYVLSTNGSTQYLSDLASVPAAQPGQRYVPLPATPPADSTKVLGLSTSSPLVTAWVAGGGGAVSSVFTRTGAVTAQSGDYGVAQVTGAAPLASPAFTGTPAAPTASPGTSTTQLATTAFVAAAVPTALLPIAIQNSAYAPVNGQFVPVDVSSAPVTVTLPATPANNTLIGVKLVKVSGSNTVTIAGNGATFNDGVATSVSLSLLNQGVVFCYNTTLNVWWALSDDLPLSGLDLRYLLLTGGTLTGPLVPKVQTLTQSGGLVAVNAGLANVYRLVLTASGWTLSNPTGFTDGQTLRIRLIQDATGGRTISYGSAWDFGAAGTPVLSPGANKVDYLVGEWSADANAGAGAAVVAFDPGH